MRIPYRHYLVFTLLIITAFSYADRLALGLVLQNIKGDLHLSDTQLGLLTGIAFAAFYSLMGIPIARWADCGNRVSIISICVALWSAMVVLTGRAATFAELLLARAGVGIGDAGTFPVANSLIPDYFPRAARPQATAVYALSWPASIVLGYFVAGWLDQLYGWRAMFVGLALPGFALAMVARLTLREPRIEEDPPGTVPGDDSGTGIGAPLADDPSAPQARASLSDVFGVLGKNKTFRHLLMSYIVNALFSAGMMQWQPAFFIRSFGMNAAEVGTWFTIMLGGGALLGIYMGGALASRYAAHNERLQFKAMAVLYICWGIAHALMFVSHNRTLALTLLGIGNLASAITGPILAAFQTIVPARMRAMAIAVVLLSSNLIGAGVGPLMAGALSDAFGPIFHEQSLRYALLALCPGIAWGAWHMWRASESVNRDLEIMDEASFHGGTQLAHPR